MHSPDRCLLSEHIHHSASEAKIHTLPLLISVSPSAAARTEEWFTRVVHSPASAASLFARGRRVVIEPNQIDERGRSSFGFSGYSSSEVSAEHEHERARAAAAREAQAQERF